VCRSFQTLGRDYVKTRSDNAGDEDHRFIAVRHEIRVETSQNELQKGWESIEEFCRANHCDIVASSISQKTSDSPPSATLSLRIAPNLSGRLMERIQTLGKIVEHKTENEDETAEVIDVEAKIKNLTELRDRLRKMLGTSNASVKDVVEMERELAKTQSEVDSLQAKRKALANQTEKVAVNISFCTSTSTAETGAFAPVTTAWHSLGHVFANSVAAAFVFVVTVIPWLVLVLPTFWFLITMWRMARGKRGT
jgi:myosin heavy subunit